jgi:hypothetical protein
MLLDNGDTTMLVLASAILLSLAQDADTLVRRADIKYKDRDIDELAQAGAIEAP